MDGDNCCSHGTCKNNSSAAKELSTKNKKSIDEFFRHVKNLYAAVLGIEILCIAAAEIGENTGLYVLGFNHIGVPIAYTIGYGSYFHYFCDNSWPIQIWFRPVKIIELLLSCCLLSYN